MREILQYMQLAYMAPKQERDSRKEDFYYGFVQKVHRWVDEDRTKQSRLLLCILLKAGQEASALGPSIPVLLTILIKV